ncbi:MAG TPA: hypothetical protein VGH23_16340 [Rhizomicrobium sp.]|jgi:hypothetical protein
MRWLSGIAVIAFATGALAVYSAYEWSAKPADENMPGARQPQNSAPNSNYKFSDADVGKVFHARQGAWTCDDPKITAELQDATDHPGTLSDDSVSQIAREGNCSPIDASVSVRILALSQLTVPAGTFGLAQAQIINPANADAPNPAFMIRQNQLFPGPGQP